MAPDSPSRLAKAAGAEPSGEMRDEKIARGCGAEQISKSKCAKHVTAGALLEVAMSKKCMQLRREAHVEVKSEKTEGLKPLLEVKLSKKCTHLRHMWKSKVKKLKVSDHLWIVEVELLKKSALRCGAKHMSKSRVLKTVGLGALLEVEM